MSLPQDHFPKSVVLGVAFMLALLMGAALSYAGIHLMGGAVAGEGDLPGLEPDESADEARQRPLKGPIPDDIPLVTADDNAPAGMPRYIPALDRAGERAGYIDYDTMIRLQRAASDQALPVYDDSLERVVGRMIPGYGFVPNGVRASDVEPFDVEVRVQE